MTERHLVTGGTGFIGGAIVLELLSQTDVEVVCLVRPHCSWHLAQDRLETALYTAAWAYGRQELIPEIRNRCRVFLGDIREAVWTGTARKLGTVSTVWHCAASLKYDDEDAAEIFLSNLEGTRNMLDLARAAGASTFNHISTAYVAGNRSGVIPEELPSGEIVTNNCYEKSKIGAEHLVASIEDMHTRILRPSIVIGHSTTYAATSFMGMYGFIREMAKFKRKVSERLGDFLSHRQIRLRADPEATLNFIPVDAVARNAVRISQSSSQARIFHLTNACPPKAGRGMGLLCREIGIREPRFVSSPREFTSIDEALNTRIDFYGSYLTGSKVFDRTNTDGALGVTASVWPLDDEALLHYVRWYLDHLERKGRAGQESATWEVAVRPSQTSATAGAVEYASGGGWRPCIDTQISDTQ